MALAQSLTGLLGVTLLVVRGAIALGPPKRARLVGIAALVVAIIPVGGICVAGYVRGFTGDLSMTTVVLLLLGTLGQLGARGIASASRAAWVLVLLAAALLYPAALGLGPFDPYSLGFAPSGLLVVLSIVSALAWWHRASVPLLCLLTAVAGYAFQVLESHNLWDYLVDPWVTLYAIYDLRPMRRNS